MCPADLCARQELVLRCSPEKGVTSLSGTNMEKTDGCGPTTPHLRRGIFQAGHLAELCSTRGRCKSDQEYSCKAFHGHLAMLLSTQSGVTLLI